MTFAGLSDSVSSAQIVSVVAAVIIREDGDVLVTQRLAGAHLGGKWEFPGGKPESGESPEEALVRELREELAVEAEVGALLLRTEHVYPPHDGHPEKTVRIAFYEASICSGEPRCVGVGGIRWVAREELATLDLPDADRPMVELLL